MNARALELEQLRVLEKVRSLDDQARVFCRSFLEIAIDISHCDGAMIHFADELKPWFETRDGAADQQTPSHFIHANAALESDEPLVVTDDDHFFAAFPLVIGQVLRIGSLCVSSTSPKVLDPTQVRWLSQLARQISHHLEYRILDREQHELRGQMEIERARMIANSKMAALGEMAAGVAHEINNPLAAILAWSGELIECAERSELSFTELAEIGMSIEKVSLRIAKTVSAMRTFAQDGEHMPFQKTELKEIFDDTLELCRQRFFHSHVELQVSEPEHGLSIKCRSVEISQVILNLLNNAFESVRTRDVKWVKLEYEVKNGTLEVSVRDSGPPIPDNVRAKLMQPFFTTKAAGVGTGLGLSISQRIAIAHRGSLALDERDANVRFVLRLPLAG